MRRILCVLAFLLFPTLAFAWDQSVLTDVRFSPDGRYFSFVEYIEPEADNWGYAYMYVIDTERDAWVRGTPLRVELNHEGANGKKALAEVRRKGLQFVERYRLRDAGAPVLPFYEVDRFDPYARKREAEVPALDGRLALLRRDATGASGCDEDSGRPADFRLVLSGRWNLTLADYLGRLPRSRGCAHDYDIAGAYLHATAERTVLAVLVGSFTRGWEGSNRTLIGVTRTITAAGNASPRDEAPK